MSNKPIFVTMDEKGRETYLSQVGNFLPDDHLFFHTLCRIWQPVISMKSFLTFMDNTEINIDEKLSRFIKKLKRLRMGLIITEIVKGIRSPYGIVLCEPNDNIFYMHVLNEEIKTIQEHPRMLFPTFQNLKSRNITIPQEHVHKISYQEAANIHVNEKSDSTRVVALPIGNQDMLILPQTSIKHILNIHILKLQKYFNNNEHLFDITASFLQRSLIDFRTNINTHNHLFWLELSRILNGQREALESNHKIDLPNDMFSVAYVLERYIVEYMSAIDKQRIRDEEKKNDMQELVDIAREYDNFLIPMEIINKHMEDLKNKYKDKFVEFHKEFDESFVYTENKKEKPQLLKVNYYYIHIDNVKSFFVQKVWELSPQLLNYYIVIMKQYIQNSHTRQTNVFNSSATFEDDIESRVRKLDVAFSNMLKQPKAVAEAIIQGGKNMKKSKSVEELETFLTSFYYPNYMRFRELQIIFGLDVTKIYQQAFSSMGIMKQFFMWLTGKHESYCNKFADQSRILFDPVVKNSIPSTNSNEPSVQNLDGGLRSKESISSRAANLPSSKLGTKSQSNKKESSLAINRHRHSQGQKSHQKNYSQKEKERAWQEFSKRLGR